MILDDWQKEALDHDGDLLLCTGRRVGKTQIMAIKAIEFLVHKKRNVVIVSLTEDQAMIIVQMAVNYLRQNYRKMEGRGKYRTKQKELTVVNPKNQPIASLFVRPVGAHGDSLRGFEGGVLVVDEAARMPERFWIAAKPIILTTGGNIWMCSTPHGKQGYFWDRFNESYNLKDPNARFKVIYKTTPQVIHERPLTKQWNEDLKAHMLKILDDDKREMSDIEFGQEYLGLFLDEILQFFPDEDIEAVCSAIPSDLTLETVMGVDLARMGGDKLVWATGRIHNNHLTQIDLVVKDYMTTPQAVEETVLLANKFKCKKVGIDAGSGTIGVAILDYLRKTNIRNKVVALNSREISLDPDDKQKQRLLKTDLYFNLLAMMQKRQITLLDDMQLKISLKSIQMHHSTSATGRTIVKIGDPREKHDHIADALIRMAHFFREKPIKLFAY